MITTEAIVLVVLAMVWFTACDRYTQENELSQTNPYPFSVAITFKEDGGPLHHGSGFIFNKQSGIIATALHAVELAEKDNSICKVLIGKHKCTARSLWKHQTADIGLLQLDSLDMMRFSESLTEAPLSAILPSIGDSVTIVGFQTDSVQNGYCLPKKTRKGNYICQREIPLTIELVDVPTQKISFVAVLEEIEKWTELQKENPTLKHEDIFYTKHLVAASDDRKYFNYESGGLSGSALIDSQGVVRAVLQSTTSSGGFVTVPLREVPQEYWPINTQKSNHH